MADLLLDADGSLSAACPVCVATPRHVRGADYSRAFLDLADAQWTRGPRLIPVSNDADDAGEDGGSSVLTPSQLVVFRFGVELAKLIQRTEREEAKDEFYLSATVAAVAGDAAASSSAATSPFKEVTLRLAHALPLLPEDGEKNARRNAFRNSFYFDAEKRVIYVRKERTHSVGGFALVVVHCLAHIEVKT